MSEHGISELVVQFLRDHISSVAQLEALLLLQTNPQQKWKADQIARELRTETPGIQVQLEALRMSGLLQRDDSGAYAYAPANEQLHAQVIALSQQYLLRRVSIITLIFSKPSEGLRAFADAFRLRKGPPS